MMRRRSLVPHVVPLLLLLVLWLLQLRDSQSANPKAPHPHMGLLQVGKEGDTTTRP